MHFFSGWTGVGPVSKSHYPGPQDLAAVLPRLAVVGGFGRRKLTVWGPTACHKGIGGPGGLVRQSNSPPKGEAGPEEKIWRLTLDLQS